MHGISDMHCVSKCLARAFFFSPYSWDLNLFSPCQVHYQQATAMHNSRRLSALLEGFTVLHNHPASSVESLQDDPAGANSAPSRKAWVSQLTVVKEVDFRRYAASRYIKHLIDPDSCVALPHGRDKWDLMAADIMDDPDLDSWPERGIRDMEQSELWATWSLRQRQNFKAAFKRRFGWAFYFGTVQVCNPCVLVS